MPEVTDPNFDPHQTEYATLLSYSDELSLPVLQGRERDVNNGVSGARQPDNTFSRGVHSGNSQNPVNPRMYNFIDEISEKGFGEPTSVEQINNGKPEDVLPLLCSIHPGQITAVNTSTFTYSAISLCAPVVNVTNQTPLYRPFDPDDVNLSMASVGDLCTIIATTSQFRLCIVPEIFGTVSACDTETLLG